MIVALLASGGPQEPPVSPLTLQSAFAAAEEHNPTLVAARLGRAVDAAGVLVAGERPNPEASFEAARDTPHEAFTLALPFELGGKRARRLDVATAALSRTSAALAVQALDVRRAVRLAYYELVAAAGRVQVSAELRDFAERGRNAARDRFASGAAPRLETLQADLALAQADNELEAAGGRLAAARAALNTIIGRAPGATAVPENSFDAGDISGDPGATVLGSPDITALDREIDEATARERLAMAMRRPDPTVSAGVLVDARPEFMFGWRGSVSLTVPLFTRHTAGVRMEAARVAQLRAARDARVAVQTGAAFAEAARVQASRRQYRRYHDEIIPQLAAVESMAEDSYRS